jgi:hypothetical protein
MRGDMEGWSMREAENFLRLLAAGRGGLMIRVATPGNNHVQLPVGFVILRRLIWSECFVL